MAQLVAPSDPPSGASGPLVRASRYTLSVDDGSGQRLLYNVMSQAFLRIPAAAASFLEDADWVAPVADLSRFQRALLDLGILVPADGDERLESHAVLDARNRRTDRLELILLPHENCNFRCVYCYESFARNKMQPQVVEAVQRLVLRRSEGLRTLTTSWFGGEPLLGFDVIRQLSRFFVDTCRSIGATYASGITTNGYLLDQRKADCLVRECEVRSFQITLDGPCDEHDRRRHLSGGAGTFQRIYTNLLGLKEVDESFRVIIRVNFDAETARAMEPFVSQLADDFAEDPRFSMHFFPISHLGGATGDGIAELPLCDVNVARVLERQLMETAVDRGFSTLTGELLAPLGSACYAADPQSFIVGSDGVLYKCTVAFDDPRNHVGRLRPDGSMDLDEEKFRLWTVNAGADDAGCHSCTFNPSCQGVACPLHRMDTAMRPCPPLKADLPGAIRLLAREMLAQQQRVQAAER